MGQEEVASVEAEFSYWSDRVGGRTGETRRLLEEIRHKIDLLCARDRDGGGQLTREIQSLFDRLAKEHLVESRQSEGRR